MSARILDGKILSAQIRSEIKSGVDAYKARTGSAPGLATILVGDNPASHTYVGSKIKACQDVEHGGGVGVPRQRQLQQNTVNARVAIEPAHEILQLFHRA